MFLEFDWTVYLISYPHGLEMYCQAKLLFTPYMYRELESSKQEFSELQNSEIPHFDNSQCQKSKFSQKNDT